LMWKIQKT